MVSALRISTERNKTQQITYGMSVLHMLLSTKDEKMSIILALVLIFTPCIVAAQDSTEIYPGVTGAWVYAGDKKEAEKLDQAINAVTAELPFYMRGLARDRITEQTAPPAELIYAVKNDKFIITRDDETVSLRFGAQPVTMEKDGKSGLMSARIDGDRIVVVSEGEEGRIMTAYGLSSDSKILTLFVQMSAKRLAGPLKYQLTYRRK
jgi:hypothetical protein